MPRGESGSFLFGWPREPENFPTSREGCELFRVDRKRCAHDKDVTLEGLSIPVRVLGNHALPEDKAPLHWRRRIAVCLSAELYASDESAKPLTWYDRRAMSAT
jgi:hypothetical protein